MVLNKKSRLLSGALTVVLLMTAVPVCVYGETGQLLSSNDQDAYSIVGWVGNSIDADSNFDFSTVFPKADWYQYNQVNLAGEPSPKDVNDHDNKNDIIEYSAAYHTKTTAVGKINKDYILNTPGYYTLNASVQVFPYMNTNKGAMRIELYDNTTGSGAPVGNSYEVSKSSSGINTGIPTWETVTVPGLYVTSKVKMIRVVLEAAVTYPDDANDFVDFDGLSVILTQTAAPPVISNLDNDTVLFTEGGSAVLLDKDNNVTVKVDSAFGRIYGGGSVTASITNNKVVAEDVLEIAQTGEITLSGSNVLYSGTTIGTYLGGTSGTSLTILLNTNANDTSVTALLKAIAYKNTNTVKPDIKPRTVMISAADNTNASEPVYTTVNVQSVNYAPVRKSGVEASKSQNATVGTGVDIDLSEIFEDTDHDTLNYKVKIDGESETVINEKYTFTPSVTGTSTLVFTANDGTTDSQDTYTLILNIKAVNTPPVRKSGTSESITYSNLVNSTIVVTLMHYFQDAEGDPLTYKVKIDNESEVTANDIFSYMADTVGTHTLVFKANDGTADSTETFTIIFEATKNPVSSILVPDPVTGITNGTAKTASTLGLPATVSLDTKLGMISANVNWDVIGSSYDTDLKTEQTFDVEGTVILPEGVYNPAGISLNVTINVTVKAEVSADKVLESISPLAPITGIQNGTDKTASELNLPEHVTLVTDQGNVSADVSWYVAASSYNPDQKTVQTFEIEGTVILPSKVINPNGVSLDITVEVTVDAESMSDKILEKVFSLSSIKGITNGTAKTVTALGIPARVTLGTDAGNVQADVIWDLDSSSYDPFNSEEQTFTVEGTVVLPDNIINPNGISLEVTINLTVMEEQAEQEYYTLRISVTKRPDKVSYTLGEDLDTQGLEVTEYQKASPSNAVRKIVLPEGQYDLEYNLARTGTRTVKVIYYAADRYGNEKEFADEFTVRVKELPRDDSRGDDDREITEPGKRNGGDDDHYYSGNWQSDDNGWKFTGKDGSRPVNRWVYTDWKGANDWYFFDEKGYMVTGWFEYKGNVYYLNPVSDGKKGYMYTGWNMIEGKWYYFSQAADDSKGSMLKDTVTPDGHRVGPDGKRIS